MKNLNEMTDSELREAFNRSNNNPQITAPGYAEFQALRDEIVSRFMARQEVPIKELLKKAFDEGFCIGFATDANLDKRESCFNDFLIASENLVPVSKPDLSEMYNDLWKHTTPEHRAKNELLSQLRRLGHITLNNINK